MPENVSNVIIKWANEYERGVFAALTDTLGLKPSLPGALLGRAIYRDNLTELINVAVTAYEQYAPGHHMRKYFEGYISEVESILREETF